MSHCTAGDRCSCGLDADKRAACSLWSKEEPIKIFGLMIQQPEQDPLIRKHCFGDCGKISMAGAIDGGMLGALMVCCHPVCPWLKNEMDEPFGQTNSFGQVHDVYLRALTDTPELTV